MGPGALSERVAIKLWVKIIESRRNTNRLENLESAAKLHCMLSMQRQVPIVFVSVAKGCIQVKTPGFWLPQCSSQHIDVMTADAGTQFTSQLSDP